MQCHFSLLHSHPTSRTLTHSTRISGFFLLALITSVLLRTGIVGLDRYMIPIPSLIYNYFLLAAYCIVHCVICTSFGRGDGGMNRNDERSIPICAKSLLISTRGLGHEKADCRRGERSIRCVHVMNMKRDVGRLYINSFVTLDLQLTIQSRQHAFTKTETRSRRGVK